MKRLILFAAALLAFAACSQTRTARFEGQVEDLADTTLLLQKVVSNQLTTLDTLKIDAKGRFHGKVAVKKGAPVFCHLFDGEVTRASLVLLPGDAVRVKLLPDGDYMVEGSEESSLLKVVNDEFRLAGYKMGVCADALEVAAAAGIRAVVSPAGSLKDADVVKRANELGVALRHAPERIFSHH